MSLQSILASPSLRWIFVGGKGGVGKTTTSSSLAIQLAHRNSKANYKTLILSTDPAHSLSDAFSQQFTDKPTAVNGVDNLYALEINPKASFKYQDDANADPLTKQILQLFNTSSIPGMDELMSFTEVMKIANSSEYKTVVFDTAPTGHTLRFLEIPQTARGIKGLFESLRGTVGGVMQMMGMGNSDEMFGAIQGVFDQCAQIEQQFANPELTQFVCVCIPEFLSLYETERLIYHLARLDIDCSCVVCNQILDVVGNECKFCASRHQMQMKYIEQMRYLYEDFDLVFMELKDKEMRGISDLEVFGQELMRGKHFKWM